MAYFRYFKIYLYLLASKHLFLYQFSNCIYLFGIINQQQLFYNRNCVFELFLVVYYDNVDVDRVIADYGRCYLSC